MNQKINTIEQLLVKEGEKVNKKPVTFVSENEIKENFYRQLEISEAERQENENYLKNISKYPHALVLSALMDRGVKAEHVWILPILIKREIGSIEFSDIYELLTLERCENIIVNQVHHRYGHQQAIYLRNAIEKIHNDYNSDISNLWKNKPSSSKVVAGFLQFNGCGIKIATMIPNILYRHFNIHFSDYIGIEVSPDLQVTKILQRTGLVPIGHSSDLTKQLVIYKAKEIYPLYPGIIDLICWEIGRNYCTESRNTSNCQACPLGNLCEKIF